MPTEFQLGDRVEVDCWGCEVNGRGGGNVVATDGLGDMRYMVMLSNSREWPFAAHELTLIHRRTASAGARPEEQR